MIILSERDYITTDWAGGSTTQLFIYPQSAKYAERDFLFRVSTAKIVAEDAEFTILQGFNRIILSLENTIELLQNDQRKILMPFEPFGFDAALPTHSRGKTTDFNVMMKAGYEATVEVINLKKECVVANRENTVSLLYFVKCIKAITIAEHSIYEKQTLILDKEEQITITASGNAATLLKVVLHIKK